MRCAIIGGGFAGAAVAIALLRALPSGHSIAIYEPCADLGRGIAYANGPDHHLLNIAAHTIAVVPEHEESFCDWVRRRFSEVEDYRAADGAYYFPRAWFGTYMRELVAAAAASNKGVELTHVRQAAQSIRHSNGRFIVRAPDGERTFERVVLAVGNGPISPLRVFGSGTMPIVAQSAWAFDASDIPASARVAIVGSGLTMADVVAELDARGFRGPIVCISRSGRRPHDSLGYRPEFTPSSPLDIPTTARQLVRNVRRWAAESIERTGHWIPCVDYVIRETPALWRALSPEERSRLRRHVRSLWEIHRYKMPPVAFRRIEALIASKRLLHLKGRVRGIVAGGVRIQAIDGLRDVPADVVVNASGFDTTYQTALAPLSGLLESTGLDVGKVAREGIAVDDRGRLLDCLPQVRGAFYGLGYLARANHGDMGTVHIIGAIANGISEDIRKAAAEQS